jgi:hypothetical protein
VAYIDQATKAKLAANLKQVMPSGWKYSLAIRNHSTIVCTIKSAPIDLIKAFKSSDYFDSQTATEVDVNPYHFRSHIEDECVADVVEKIFEALDEGNHDNSNIQTDYFDVGWYVSLHIGRWNKPFVFTSDKGWKCAACGSINCNELEEH